MAGIQVYSAMSLAVVAVAFSSIFVTNLERSGVPPLVVAFYRMGLATALLLPPAVATKWREMTTLARGDLAMLLLGGLCLAIHFGAWTTSLRYIPIATSVVLVASHPLFVVVAAHVILGERPTRRSLVGVVTGLVGTGIICREGVAGVELAMVGDGLALLGALAIVGYFIVGRKMRVRVGLLAYVTPLYAVCSVILLAWAAGAGNRLYPYGTYEWAHFAALAVVPTILGHTVFNWALRHVRASSVSITFLGEPVVASLLAFIFFSQQPPESTLLGGALVLVGIYLTTSSSETLPR